MTLSPGARVGLYEISGLIGVGGMGEVYRATDGTLGRDDYLWTPGGPDWVRGRDVTELADLFSAPPPPPPPAG